LLITPVLSGQRQRPENVLESSRTVGVVDVISNAAKTMRIPKFNKLFEVMQIKGVKVFVHWSVLLIGALILLGALEEPLLAFTVLAAYYGVILLHECGVVH
jgi:hypothetical protein